MPKVPNVGSSPSRYRPLRIRLRDINGDGVTVDCGTQKYKVKPGDIITRNTEGIWFRSPVLVEGFSENYTTDSRNTYSVGLWGRSLKHKRGLLYHPMRFVPKHQWRPYGWDWKDFRILYRWGSYDPKNFGFSADERNFIDPLTGVGRASNVLTLINYRGKEIELDCQAGRWRRFNPGDIITRTLKGWEYGKPFPRWVLSPVLVEGYSYNYKEKTVKSTMDPRGLVEQVNVTLWDFVMWARSLKGGHGLTHYPMRFVTEDDWDFYKILYRWGRYDPKDFGFSADDRNFIDLSST
jgi:hypothetical protein